MIRKFTIILVIIACTLAIQCGHDGSGISKPDPRVDINRELTASEISLIEADNDFAFRVFNKINKADADQNIFISPFSISMALGMTLNGADGATKTAMEEVLGYYGMTTEEINSSYRSLYNFLSQMDWDVELNIANSIWYREGFPVKQDFIDVNKTYFNAEIAELNFSDSGAADLINGWINSKTNGKIPKVIEDTIDHYIVMYLINAIYFKGVWQNRFDPDDTRDKDFFLEDGSTKTVKMMLMNNSARLYKNVDYEALELPYGEGHYNMTIILPRAGLSVNELVESMTQEEWQTIRSSMQDEQELLIEIPRFKLTYKKSLKETLKDMGMGVAFTSQANFLNIADAPLAIDDVIHSTFVEVNEEGTEAAAVTVVSIRLTSAPPGFVADRPFLFIISEKKTDTILFMGKMLDPEGE